MKDKEKVNNRKIIRRSTIDFEPLEQDKEWNYKKSDTIQDDSMSLATMLDRAQRRGIFEKMDLGHMVGEDGDFDDEDLEKVVAYDPADKHQLKEAVKERSGSLKFKAENLKKEKEEKEADFLKKKDAEAK